MFDIHSSCVLHPNKEVQDISNCLNDHVIRIIPTPKGDDKKYRMHPCFRKEDTGPGFSDYEINKQYHDHIEKYMSKEELEQKRKKEQELWSKIDEQIANHIIEHMDMKHDTLYILKNRCYTEGTWIKRDEYLKRQTNILMW